MIEDITISDLAYGDVSLYSVDPIPNIGIPKYQSYSAYEIFIKIAAYAIYANRIYIPGSCILVGDELFYAISNCRELLKEGVIVVGLRNDIPDFCSLAKEKKLGVRGIRRALFLDSTVGVVYKFDARHQTALYKMQIINDLAENGNLTRLLLMHKTGKEFETKLSELRKLSFSLTGFREEFIDNAEKICGEMNGLIKKWASWRYYTTPYYLDKIRFRDIHPEVAEIIIFKKRSHIDERFDSSKLPTPVSNISEKLGILYPKELTETDIERITGAILKTRQDIPEARAKFSEIIKQGKLEHIDQVEINRRFWENMHREKILPESNTSISKRLKDSLTGVIAVNIIEVGINFISGFEPSFFAEIFFDLFKPSNVRNTKSAPFRMAYETFSNKLT